METILLGTRAYQWAVPIFAHLFAKHWGDDPILWYGDSHDIDLPANVEFRRVPCYSEGEWPWTPWFSNGLRSILNDLTGFIIGLFLPDHWISQPVDVDAVHALAKFMDENGHVVRGNLTAGTCLEGYGQRVAMMGNYEIVTVSPSDIHCGLQGGITFCPSLFTRGLLREALSEPHWNLWRVESEGTAQLTRTLPGICAVGLRPGPVHRVHGLYHERGKVANFTGLRREDFDAVRHFVPSDWKIEYA